MRELKEVAKEIKETVRKFTNEDGNWNRKIYSENRIYINNKQYNLTDEQASKLQALSNEVDDYHKATDFSVHLEALAKARQDLSIYSKENKISETDAFQIKEEIKMLLSIYSEATEKEYKMKKVESN